MKHLSEKRANQFIDLVNKEYNKNGASELFARCEQVCYNTQNIALMIEFASRVKGANVQLFADFIVENGTPEQNYAFLKKVQGVDVQKHVDVIVAGGNADLCFDVVKNFPNININGCERVVLKDGAYFDCYLFARDVKGATVWKFQEIVLQSNNPALIGAFALDVQGADVYECYKKLFEIGAKAEICQKVFDFMPTEYQLKIQLERLELVLNRGEKPSAELLDNVCKYSKLAYNEQDLCIYHPLAVKLCARTKNPKFAIKLCESVKGSLKELANVVLEYGDLEDCYQYAKVTEYGTYSLAQRIIQEKSPQYCYLLCRDCNTLHKDALEETLLEIKSPHFSYLFAKDIEDADVIKHQIVVMEHGTSKQVVEFLKNVKGANLEMAYQYFALHKDGEEVIKYTAPKISASKKLTMLADEIEK